MDATVIAFVLVALLIGAALGWLWASRESAGAKQTVENLRLQLDEGTLAQALRARRPIA
jgi:DNA recombination protein RmuC